MRKERQLISAAFMVTCIFAGMLFFNSCDSQTNPKKSEKTKNCDAEYMKLSTREFSSCSEALLSIGAFLNEFSNNGSCLSCCEHAREISVEFDEMKSFLDKDVTYSRFIENGEIMNEKFSASSFETVRKTWETVYRKEKHRRYDLALSEITPEVFRPYLEKCARQHCLDRWHRGGNALTGWEIKESKLLGEISVSNKNDGKYGYGTFHVDMEGAGPFGWREGSADVKVIGIITILSDGSLSFVESAGYEFKNIIHLDR